MSSSQFLRFAGWSAYVSAIATILGFATLIAFFALGNPYGTLNDVCSILIVLSAVPVVFALYRLHRPSNPMAGLLALVMGFIAILAVTVFQIILILTAKTFGDTVTTAYGFFGVSLMIYGCLALADKILPRGLAWFGILAGVGYVLVITGFILGGENHPLTSLGGLVAIVAFPTWAIWLGRLLLSGRFSPH
jgi:Domain of unknown function (DUF4386)